MVDAKNKHKLPFNIYSASIEGGYHDTVSSSFSPGTDIVNYHEDNYGEIDEAPLQSPFTERWVGGHEHRHVDLNRGTDEASNRREAWHIDFPNTGSLRIYGHNYRSSPPAYWTRQGLAKRPLNIQNIKTLTSSISHGNYQHDYQIVQTAGRRINNRFLVKNEGVMLDSFSSSYVTGADDYALPDRGIGNNKFIFVNRFAAPGGPEVSSRGALDLESEELSTYNSLNNRNLRVRLPLNEWLTQHAGPQGFSSFEEDVSSWYTDNPVASYHKVNRNSTKRYKEFETYINDWSSETFSSNAFSSSNAESNGNFGFSIDLRDASTIAVGAPNESVTPTEGRVYVYTKSGLAEWTLLLSRSVEPYTSSVGLNGWTEVTAIRNYGENVKFSGNYLAVAAPGLDIESFIEDDWDSASPTIEESPNAAAVGYYAFSLDYQGGRRIVGAPSESFISTEEGRAYIYNGSGVSWTLEETLTASDAAPSDRFGYNVAISGNYAAVSSPQQTVGADSNAGMVYVFRSSSGGWYEEAQITASDSAAGDYFGGYVTNIEPIKCLDMVGNRIFVGAPDSDPGGTTSAGKVYVYNSSSAGWTEEAILSSSNKQALGLYGWSVSAYGSVLGVGAPQEDGHLSATNGGKYYAYRSGSSGWLLETVGSGTTNNGYEGRSMDITNDSWLVGRPVFPSRVTLFLSGASGWLTGPNQIFTGSGSSQKFGASVKIFNSASLAISAYEEENSLNNTGSVYIFRNGSGGWYQAGKVQGSSGEPQKFGFTLEFDGDRTTLVVGDNFGYANDRGTVHLFDAQTTSVAKSSAGGVFIYKNYALEQLLVASDAAASDYFGGHDNINFETPTALDMHSGTIIVGAPNSDPGAISKAGKAYIFVSGTSGWTEQAILSSSQPSSNDEFGHSVAVYGDVAAIGTPFSASGPDLTGKVEIYRRSGTTWNKEQELVLSPSDYVGADDPALGASLSLYDDTLAVGANLSTTTAYSRVHIYKYNGSSWKEEAVLKNSDSDNNDEFGDFVYLENTSSLVVGAWQWENGVDRGYGKAYVFQKINNIWENIGALEPSGNQIYFGEDFGKSVAISGKTLVVGEPEYNLGTFSNDGAVHSYYASGSTLISQILCDTNKNDNWFVQRSIPATDMGYAWITASAVTTRCELPEYQTEGRSSNKNNAYTDIVFVSSSQVKTS